ncbi:MAG: hybrid sensor histidine kinase/response regulator, partial [Desulfomonilaceae bacterium]
TWAGRPATLNFLTDITDIKRAEETNARTERLRAIGELASGVAHNFNNLLQVIMGSAELALVNLKNGDLSMVSIAMERLRDSARYGSETVKRLQSFARIRANDSDSEIGTFDLSDVAKRSYEMSKPLWKTNPERDGINVEMELNLADGCFISGKDSELFEVLLNLIKNSVESMPGGGRITITTMIDGSDVVLKVQDTGVGIAKSDFDRLFDPFWTSKGPAGTGLGLAVTHGIVKRHGGVISVESDVGKGSTFIIKIPLAVGATEKTAGSIVETLPQKLNVLIVDDSKTVLMVLGDLLAIHNYTIFAANSGQEAIDTYQRENIDIIISDLGMPGITGWEIGRIVKSICAKKGTPKTPFILLTGWGGQSLEPDKISDCGIDGILEKPVDFRGLLQMIGRLTTSNHLAQPLPV